jgi:uncharacterized protein YjbJ (UPF0337 family)
MFAFFSPELNFCRLRDGCQDDRDLWLLHRYGGVLWGTICNLNRGAPRVPGAKSQFDQGVFMNWDQIEGKWKQFRGAARKHWGQLTDDDLTMIAGSREKFIGKLQERYGLVREEAQKRADEWARTLREESEEKKTFTGKS